MAKNFIQPGEVMDYLATANLVSGAGVLVGQRLGVALKDIPNGTSGPVQVTGVWSLPKLATDTFVAGAIAYWDDTAKRLTATAASNTVAGYAFKAGASGAATLAIKLNA
ncbi:DUF2190 family protein [Chitinimonas arctica]|uniref:DUF2190 family protein n=1 Tax=Chitinimonas arctica TaxID=2594795 RepID=A0A516SEX3_9NEIS|nr:DUF2190 family protein [Chitinimonas arctica]QDQ26707.1 DUF2190 family protein [Chitinimonas arctica]